MKRDRPATAAEAETAHPGRGRKATGPTEIPAKGWMDIALRFKAEVAKDNLALIAAGVAFYSLLAIFPAITALMSIAGLLYRPEDLVSVLEGAAGIVPPDVSRILLEQAQAVAGSGGGGLSVGLALGLALALWSGSNGVGSLIQGLNVAYGEHETRGFARLKLQTIGMTGGMMLGLIVAASLIVFVPIGLTVAVLPARVERVVQLLAYVPLALFFVAGVSVLYRWGPDRARAKWRWLTPGAFAAAILWLAASIGFSVYVQTFGSYNETFGSIAGVIVLLMWLWLSAFAVLLGAKLNAEMEAQTARDSTTGPREPMGHRNAVKADELGHAS